MDDVPREAVLRAVEEAGLVRRVVDEVVRRLVAAAEEPHAGIVVPRENGVVVDPAVVADMAGRREGVDRTALQPYAALAEVVDVAALDAASAPALDVDAPARRVPDDRLLQRHVAAVGEVHRMAARRLEDKALERDVRDAPAAEKRLRAREARQVRARTRPDVQPARRKVESPLARAVKLADGVEREVLRAKAHAILRVGPGRREQSGGGVDHLRPGGGVDVFVLP